MKFLRAAASMSVSFTAAVLFALPCGVFSFIIFFFQLEQGSYFPAPVAALTRELALRASCGFKALLMAPPRGSALGAEQDIWRCLRRQTSKRSDCCCKRSLKQILFFFLGGMRGLFEKEEGSPACWPRRAQQWASRLLALRSAGAVTRFF